MILSAKKQVTKEALISAAFEIVREEGIDALNMRTLAQKCNCSTQPIYLSFKNAEEVKSEVLKLAVDKYNGYLQNESGDKYENKYKAVGMGYIRFAKEDKELFKWLFMRKRSDELDLMENSFENTVNLIMKSFSLPKEKAQRLQLELWVFVHGIGTLLATDYINWSWDDISAMLTDAFTGVYNKITGEY